MVRIFITAPEGSSVQYLDRQLRQVEAIAMEEVHSGNARRVNARSGGFGRNADVNTGMIFMPLVLWGEHDPYIPNEFGPRYAERLGDAELERYPDGGHWAWIDRPDAIDRAVAFVSG